MGLSRGSPADTAGISQGDEILGVQGTTLDPSVTPFQAASFIQSGGTQLLQSHSAPSAASALPTSAAAPVADNSSLAAAASSSRGSSSGDSRESSKGSSSSKAPLLSDDMVLQVRRTNGSVVDLSMPRPTRTAIPSPVAYSVVQDVPPPTGRQSKVSTRGSTSGSSSSLASSWWESATVQNSIKSSSQPLTTPHISSTSSSSPSNVKAEPGVGDVHAATNVSHSSPTGSSTGLIKLTSFNARAQRDLAAAITDLDSKGVGRYVLDLRDNRGGLVSEGLEVARLFLEGELLGRVRQCVVTSANVPVADRFIFETFW